MAQARRSIEEKIASGQYYDALQVVKTLHRRLSVKGKKSEAAQLCVENARRFNDTKQYELAVDLGKDLVSSLEASQASPSDENISQIEAVLVGIPPGAARIQKYALLNQALKWSTTCCSGGHPGLHRVGAMAYWAEKEFGKCQGHLVYCGDGPCLAQMVSEWREQGYPNERDLFALRTLLILLSLNDLTTARTFWESITESRPSFGSEAVPTSASTTSAPASSAREVAAAPDSTSQLEQSHVGSDDVPEASPDSVSSAEAEALHQINLLRTELREELIAAMATAEADQCMILDPETTPASQPVPSAPVPVVACGTFLLAAAEANNLEFFRMVRGKYALVIRRDQSFDKYLNEIESHVFGAQAQRSGLGAMFEALMGGLGGGPAGGATAMTTLS